MSPEVLAARESIQKVQADKTLYPEDGTLGASLDCIGENLDDRDIEYRKVHGIIDLGSVALSDGTFVRWLEIKSDEEWLIVDPHHPVLSSDGRLYIANYVSQKSYDSAMKHKEKLLEFVKQRQPSENDFPLGLSRSELRKQKIGYFVLGE